MDSLTDLHAMTLIAPRPRPRIRRLPQARERRASPRVAVELDFEERVEGSRFFRLTSDLSTFGLSTRTGTPHPVGTILELALYLPDETLPVRVQAEVVAHRTHQNGMRLAFRNPSIEAIRRVHRFLMSHLDRKG